jgi:hypothetical protein
MKWSTEEGALEKWSQEKWLPEKWSRGKIFLGRFGL